MSLQLETTIETVEGYSLENVYARVAVADQISGEYLQAQAVLFVSEQAFLDGKQQISSTLELTITSSYERGENNKDILDVAHDLLIFKFADQGVVATKML